MCRWPATGAQSFLNCWPAYSACAFGRRRRYPRRCNTSVAGDHFARCRRQILSFARHRTGDQRPSCAASSSVQSGSTRSRRDRLTRRYIATCLTCRTESSTRRRIAASVYCRVHKNLSDATDFRCFAGDIRDFRDLCCNAYTRCTGSGRERNLRHVGSRSSHGTRDITTRNRTCSSGISSTALWRC